MVEHHLFTTQTNNYHPKPSNLNLIQLTVFPKHILPSLNALTIEKRSYLQHDLLHFFVRTLKLTDQDQHHFSGVVVGIFSIHEWYKIPNSLQKGSQTLEIKDDCK